jgi:hypothetical protein
LASGAIAALNARKEMAVKPLCFPVSLFLPMTQRALLIALPPRQYRSPQRYLTQLLTNLPSTPISQIRNYEAEPFSGRCNGN